ncbi:hypothetical protein A3J20_03530, partial [Candidatus Gottesmanbacteria bacterium RIFCSPLOWO2_02_FULL_42_29]
PLLDNHFFRQTQTATVARNYYLNGFDLLKSELDIFGTGREKYLTMEFPLYQNLVAGIYYVLGPNDYWGRAVSAAAGFTAAWYLYKLVYAVEKKKKLAYVSAFFFLAVPLSMIYQRSFLIETTVLAFLSAGFYYTISWVENKKKVDFILACILLSLGFMQKGMYGPFLILPLWFYFFKKTGKIINAKMMLILVIPLTALFIWQRHVDILNIASGHIYYTSGNPSQWLWNVGRLSDRLSIAQWQVRWQQLLNGIFLKPGLILFLVGLIANFPKKHNWFWLSFLTAEIIYFLIFFRIQSHEYYQLVMIAPVAFYMSAGLMVLYAKKYFLWSRLFMILILTVFLYKSWLNSQNGFTVDWPRYERLRQINKALPLNSAGLLVTPEYDWNSVYTYYPGRKMLIFDRHKADKKKFEELKEKGYDFVVLQDWRSFESSPDFLIGIPKILENEEFKVYLSK